MLWMDERNILIMSIRVSVRTAEATCPTIPYFTAKGTLHISFKNARNNLDYTNQTKQSKWKCISSPCPSAWQDFNMYAVPSRRFAQVFAYSINTRRLMHQLLHVNVCAGGIDVRLDLTVQLLCYHLTLTYLPIQDMQEYFGR